MAWSMNLLKAVISDDMNLTVPQMSSWRGVAPPWITDVEAPGGTNDSQLSPFGIR